VDKAVAAAKVGPAEGPSLARHLSDARTLLVAGPPFVLERIDLAPNSHWELQAEHEFWVLVIKGRARIGPINAFVGEGIFLEAERTTVDVGSEGLGGLCAYPGSEPSPSLLRDLDFRNAGSPVYSAKARP
jgi:mannose-6-phosphate isomerase